MNRKLMNITKVISQNESFSGVGPKLQLPAPIEFMGEGKSPQW